MTGVTVQKEEKKEKEKEEKVEKKDEEEKILRARGRVNQTKVVQEVFADLKIRRKELHLKRSCIMFKSNQRNITIWEYQDLLLSSSSTVRLPMHVGI